MNNIEKLTYYQTMVKIETEELSEKEIDYILNRFKKSKKMRMAIVKSQDLSENFMNSHIEILNWVDFSTQFFLSDEIIEKYPDKIDWEIISRYRSLSENFIRKYKNKVIWKIITRHQYLSEKFIEEMEDYIDWDNLPIRRYNFSEEFLNKYQPKLFKEGRTSEETLEYEYFLITLKKEKFPIQEIEKIVNKYPSKKIWKKISSYQILTEDFMRKYKDQLNWSKISENQTLSESFIREMKDYVDWYYITMYQKLSESFIEEFSDKINWEWIEYFQNLSDEFKRKFRLNGLNLSPIDKLRELNYSQTMTKIKKGVLSEGEIDFIFKRFKNSKLMRENAIMYQNISEDFIRTHIDDFNWRTLCSYKKLSEKFIEEYKERVDWEIISYKQNLSEDFIRKYAIKLDWDGISRYQKLSEKFIEEFRDMVNWNYIIESQNVSDDLLSKCGISKEYIQMKNRMIENQYLYYYYIERLRNLKLQEHELDKILYRLGDNPHIIKEISKNQVLSENLIRKYADILDWELMSDSQKLSESLIEDFSDKVDWFYISSSQKLSREFLRKHWKDLDWDIISMFQNLSEEIIMEFKDLVNWEYIKEEYQNLSDDFLSTLHF